MVLPGKGPLCPGSVKASQLAMVDLDPQLVAGIPYLTNGQMKGLGNFEGLRAGKPPIFQAAANCLVQRFFVLTHRHDGIQLLIAQQALLPRSLRGRL